MTFAQRTESYLVMKAFTESQFCYSTLVWVSCRRQANVWESHIHERPLRAPNNGVSPFEKLLQKDRPATIHQTNWELLVPEFFKVKNNISKDSITYFCLKGTMCVTVFVHDRISH